MLILKVLYVIVIVTLLVAGSVGYTVLSKKIKHLSAQVKTLEKRTNEVETFKEQGVRHLADDIIKFYREDTNKQLKRVDEMIKIFDERRSALENQMNMTSTLSDTLIDAFKHRLDEAEQDRRGKEDRNEQ